MTAEEALEFGFIDSIYSPDEVDDKAKTLFDLTVFDNVPDKLKGKKEITAKDLEDTLRSAGCTQKQAKAIISEGFKTDQRDVAVKPDKKVVDKDQRDVALPKDLVTDLLVRAETMAPGNN
jgi:enoyl-CoA hydratase/carnithine racemase